MEGLSGVSHLDVGRAGSLGPVTHEKASCTRQATLELNRMCVVTDTRALNGARNEELCPLVGQAGVG